MSGFWEWLDTWCHRLRVSNNWVCNRFDLSLGMTPDELHRKAPQ